ncbi:hypothetical protein BB561_005594 [Smittium simulii]|uniref:SH3 domain-containing protein n=1 Tax=Smittium simulii TaxID=133385 RepID=A0A2T9Y9M8_9FUNG|nr:hypothetical protein BB561_005594 [Smittium simulii]
MIKDSPERNINKSEQRAEEYMIHNDTGSNDYSNKYQSFNDTNHGSDIEKYADKNVLEQRYDINSTNKAFIDETLSGEINNKKFVGSNVNSDISNNKNMILPENSYDDIKSAQNNDFKNNNQSIELKKHTTDPKQLYISEQKYIEDLNSNIAELKALQKNTKYNAVSKISNNSNNSNNVNTYKYVKSSNSLQQKISNINNNDSFIENNKYSDLDAKFSPTAASITSINSNNHTNNKIGTESELKTSENLHIIKKDSKNHNVAIRKLVLKKNLINNSKNTTSQNLEDPSICLKENKEKEYAVDCLLNESNGSQKISLELKTINLELENIEKVKSNNEHKDINRIQIMEELDTFVPNKIQDQYKSQYQQENPQIEYKNSSSDFIDSPQVDKNQEANSINHFNANNSLKIENTVSKASNNDIQEFENNKEMILENVQLFSEIEGSKVICHVKALYDYISTDTVELTLKEECIISVLQKRQDGWWKGAIIYPKNDLAHKIGLFPSNYTEPL